MRKYGRKDNNQKSIENACLKIGASIIDMSPLGNGNPDLCVGFRGVNYLFEIKNGSKPPSQRKLTPLEYVFYRTWQGHVYTVYSVDDVLSIIKARF
jgi:hypothetical protein